MSKKFNELSVKHIEFIEQQKIFFVGTAAANGTVNISPKGYGSLKVLSPNRIIWLNVTGSGNETSAHVQINPRMTIMFTSFDGSPVTLRIYGKAQVIHKLDEEWGDLNSHFDQIVGARQIFDLTIELVQTSCGMSIPYFEYKEGVFSFSDVTFNATVMRVPSALLYQSSELAYFMGVYYFDLYKDYLR